MALERLSDNHLMHIEDGLDSLIEAMQVSDDEGGMVPIPGE